MTVSVFDTLTNDFMITYYENFPNIIREFFDSFQQEFKELCKHIKEKCDFSIAIMDFTMLRTNIIQQKYVAEVIVYGKDHCFDKDSMAVGTVDVEPIFKSYKELSKMVLKESRKYPMMLTSNDAKAYMMSVCSKFYDVFTFILRKHIYELSQMSEFKELPFAEAFEINCGEYAAYTETIYIRNPKKVLKEEKKVLKIGENCNFKDFTNLDLGQEVFEYSDFRFSDFSFCNLTNSNFQSCNLDFSRFREVSARNVHFRYSVLKGTDFRSADLRDAQFYAVTNKVYYEKNIPVFKMEYIISFQNADLRGTVFQKCDLSNVDFTNADMRNAKLDSQSIRTANLSEEQRAVSKEYFD